MKRISLAMSRDNLENIPAYSVPTGFKLRLFREEDIENWAKVEVAAGEFVDEQTAKKRFTLEFGEYIAEMKKRCLLLENEQGEVIGTATAWYGKMTDAEANIGRIHWLGIVPAYQGRGLAKPLLSAALHILKKYHKKAYLTSQTTSYQAINLYLNFGFKPVQTTSNWQVAWSMMEDVLKRKIITV